LSNKRKPKAAPQRTRLQRTISPHPDLWDALVKRAAAEDRPVSQELDRALREYLNMPKGPEV
jgi:hypothetical protein